MSRHIVLIVLVLLSTRPLYSQMNEQLPVAIRWNSVKSLPYVEEKLKGGGLTSEDKILYISILSGIYNRMGQYQKSDSILERIKNANTFSLNTQTRLFLAKANAKKYTEKLIAANAYYSKATQLAKRTQSIGLQAEVHTERAEFHRKNSQFDFAKAHVDSALRLLEKTTSFPEIKAFALHRLAAIMNETNRTVESLGRSRESIALSKKCQNPYFLATSYNEMGYSFKHLRIIDSTLYYYRQAAKSFQAAGMAIDAIQARFNLYEFCSHNELYVDSLIPWFEGLVADIDQRNIPFSKKMAYLYIHINYGNQKNYKKALEAYQLFHLEDHTELYSTKNQELQKIRQEFENKSVLEDNKRISAALRAKKREISRKNTTIAWIFVGLILIATVSFLTLRLYSRSKKMAGTLIKQNAEKDLLIQEVHHRVKNNLNIIHSLLEMQVKSADSPSEMEVLEEASRRIASVSLVHEMLYNENSEEKVNISVYVKDLLAHLQDGFDLNKKLTIDLDMEAISFNVQDCTAIGLLITECFTNSAKHAFLQVEQPLFGLRMKENSTAKTYDFEMWDNGHSSLTPDEISQRASLGMRLIDIFSRQLKGEFALQIEKGFYYKIKIPMP